MSPKLPMSLRSLFLVTAVIALICALLAGVERSWFGPAREGMEAQQAFEKMFATKGWNGQAVTIHYFREVRILMNDIDEKELEEIFPLLHSIRWLRVIRVDQSRLTDEAQARWRAEFPNCILVVNPSK